nr:unnamed protein product [Callosobruchus chinensis]
MPDDTTLAIIADNAIGIEANVMIPDLSCPINETERFNILPSATREADKSYELKNDNAEHGNGSHGDADPSLPKGLEEEDSKIISTEYTKKGTLRMRKKYKYSVSERREKHLEKVKRQHNVLEGCGETCRKKCGQNITNGRRIDINKQFWNMSRHDQKSFVMGCIVSSGIKRKTAGESSRRLKTNKYYLKNEEGQSVCICKTFFLTTQKEQR